MANDASRRWLLRVPGGAIYGPVDLPGLRRWAEEGRVTAECEVSADAGGAWRLAAAVPELELHWFVARAAGEFQGPFNLRALRDLLFEGGLSWDDTLIHASKGKRLLVRAAAARIFGSDPAPLRAELAGERARAADLAARLAATDARLRERDAANDLLRSQVGALDAARAEAESQAAAARDAFCAAAEKAAAAEAALRAAEAEAAREADRRRDEAETAARTFAAEKEQWLAARREAEDKRERAAAEWRDEAEAWHARESALQGKIEQLSALARTAADEARLLRQQLENARGRPPPHAARLSRLEAQAQDELRAWMKGR